MRLMQAGEIPAFVEEIIQTGCDICAIVHDHYMLADLEEMGRRAGSANTAR